MEKITVSIIGCGRRTREIYIPIINAMKDHVVLKSVCNRTEEKAKEIGIKLNVPYFTSVDELIKKEKPDIAIVSVSRSGHAEPAVRLLESGINVLLETPIAETLSDADLIINAAQAGKVKLEIAENYYRVPHEMIVQKLIRNNVFGRINTVYSNFMGHGYHGFSLMRSYLGFDAKPVSITGFTKTFPVQNHTWRAGEPPRDSEKWQHAVIEYDNGSTGVYSFGSLTYGSPMRVEKEKTSVSFYAEKGMGLGHDLVVIKGMDERISIPVMRNTEIIENTEVVVSYRAGAGIDIEWVNPLADCPIDEKKLGVALSLLDLMDAVRNDTDPPYGALNAKIDRETELKMEESSAKGGKPVLFR